MTNTFLPATAEEFAATGADRPDFVYVSGDAYVDHPSFGAAIITRILDAAGFSVAVLAQPDFRSCEDFKRYGKPRLGFLVSSGNIDSMVAHYTAAKKKRSEDYYSPGKKAGLRPDRAVIVYTNRIREAYGDVPVIIGGLEASLRRFAHYDYWDNKVRRSVLVDSRADILSYGMGERSIYRIAQLLAKGVPVKKIRDVPGTAYLCRRGEAILFDPAGGTRTEPQGFDYDELKASKTAYAEAFAEQYRNNDSVNGRALVEFYGDRMLVVNPPSPPLEREELDRVYALPYQRTYHPMYEEMGGVPAIDEVRFSITHNRGCFGGCNFCAIAYHQGRAVRSRSEESVINEAKLLTRLPDFKGYIHDVGGPTANFRYPACKKQLTAGVCRDRRCLFPKPCPNLRADHREYMELLRKISALDGVKKVFVRSGIRYDYMMADKDDTFFRYLVANHVSGQLKVAPEHCSPNVLAKMGKPDIAVYERFRKKFLAFSAECGKEQYIVPYLMSGHPGSTLDDAIELALYTKKIGLNPEQVQDFYPTPGSASTVMYYTGRDPFTGEEVHVPDGREKALQRALLQYKRPENRSKVRDALFAAGRADLIGYGPDCLIPPSRKGGKADSERNTDGRIRAGKSGAHGADRVNGAAENTHRTKSAHQAKDTRIGRNGSRAEVKRNSGANGTGASRPASKAPAKPKRANGSKDAPSAKDERRSKDMRPDRDARRTSAPTARSKDATSKNGSSKKNGANRNTPDRRRKK